MGCGGVVEVYFDVSRDKFINEIRIKVINTLFIKFDRLSQCCKGFFGDNVKFKLETFYYRPTENEIRHFVASIDVRG